MYGAFPLELRARWKADVGIRTPDLLITSELLYQLSYVGRTSAPAFSITQEERRAVA